MFFFKNIESYLTLTLLRILSDTDRSTTLSGLRQPDSVVDLSVLKLLAHYVIGFFVLQKGLVERWKKILFLRGKNIYLHLQKFFYYDDQRTTYKLLGRYCPI